MARPQEFDTTEVLQQAMRVFWNRGYEAASLAELLQATGLSKSSLYGAFGSKHELLLTAFDAYRENRRRDMARMFGTGTARAGIEAFFRMIVADSRDPERGSGCMSINQAVELAPHDAEVRRRVEEDFQSIEDALVDAITRGQVEGSGTSRKLPRDLARLLVVAFPGLQVMVRAGVDPTRTENALTQVLTLLD
jgi:TetR/AcrR family transcriptional repressor of nem operon